MTENPHPFLLTKRAAASPSSDIHLILAHGAGAPATSPFMENLCTHLAEDHAIATTRFEFAYMAARRTGASKRPPPKAQKLIPEYIEAIEAVAKQLAPGTRIAIGGKSMGGRVASLITQQCFDAGKIRALVCLGYPFHPPKKPENLRTAHLTALTCPSLIIQGERDALGNRDEVKTYNLPASITVHWSPDGDHDLKPRVRSGTTHDVNIADAATAISAFLQHLPDTAHPKQR